MTRDYWRNTNTFSIPVIVCLLLGAHAGLVAYSSALHSPVLDETGHLPCGLAVWKFGRVDLYPNNPPLVKSIAALPLMFVEHEEDWADIDNPPLSRPEFSLGYDFINANGEGVFWLFALARWACIPFALLGGWVCFRWASELYGARAGLLALTLWCFSPNILGIAQTITPDTGACALGLLASYSFWRWTRSPGWARAVFVGVTLGLANLCKFTWVILFPLWVLLFVFVWLSRRNWAPSVMEIFVRRAVRTDRRETDRNVNPTEIRASVVQLGLAFAIAALIINAGYGFKGTLTPLGDLHFFSRALGGSDYSLGMNTPRVGGNKFRRTTLGRVPIPLPEDYVRGIDLQKRDFEQEFTGYLRGRWKKGGWWYYYLYGLAVKTPVGTLALFGLCVGVSLLVAPSRTALDEPGGSELGADDACFHLAPPGNFCDELILLAPAAVILTLVSCQTGINMFIRYVLPAVPLLFVWVSKLARPSLWQFGLCRAIVIVCLLCSILSSMRYVPHSASYFNELVGGPLGGPDHLIDSNIGWGQDLLFLKRWYDDHPEARPLGLVYFGNMDARVASIEFDIPPSGPVSLNHRCQLADKSQGPQPGWYAVDVSFTRGMRRFVRDGRGEVARSGRHCDFSYFQHFEPVDHAGYSVYIYHITLEEANRVRTKLGQRELPNTP